MLFEAYREGGYTQSAIAKALKDLLLANDNSAAVCHYRTKVQYAPPPGSDT